MTKAKQKPPDDPEQSRRFIEAAKELEADESGPVFEKALKAVRMADAKSPPPAKRVAGKKPRSG